jgi:hypothetical protein
MQEHSTKGESGSGHSREWYQKPLGMLTLAVAGGILVWIVTNALQHLFAPEKPVVQEQSSTSQQPQPKRQDTAEPKEREKPKPAVKEDH